MAYCTAAPRVIALPQMLAAGLLNNGQACAAQTRFLAPRSRYREVVEAMAAAIRRTASSSRYSSTNLIGLSHLFQKLEGRRGFRLVHPAALRF